MESFNFDDVSSSSFNYGFAAFVGVGRACPSDHPVADGVSTVRVFVVYDQRFPSK